MNRFNPIAEDVKRGTGFMNGKERVKAFFKEHRDKQERIDFLKQEYGVGGYCYSSKEPNRITGNDHDSKGIRVRYNNEKCEELTKLYKWNEVVDTIKALIVRGEY